MRLWKVVVLVNVALAAGYALGHVTWLREVRVLRSEVERLRAEAARAGEKSVTARGIVRSMIPRLGVVILTHETLPGLMEAMTMPFRAEDAAILEGLAPGDAVRFTVRQEGQELRLVAIEKLPAP